jgi:hypothetical protein
VNGTNLVIEQPAQPRNKLPDVPPVPAHRFDIQPADRPIIETSVRLGNWLAKQPEITEKQRAAIRTLQDALRWLPEHTPGLDAAYGFGGRVQTKHGRTYRCWEISMWPPDMLEIFSIYTPEIDVELWEKTSDERSFTWLVGRRGFEYGPQCFDLWIRDVLAADEFRRRCTEFEITAEVLRQSDANQ